MLDGFDQMVNALNQQIHYLDAAELAAAALAIALVAAVLLAAVLVAAIRALRCLGELRDMERDGYIRHYQALEAILHQTTTCTAEVVQMKREIATYAANREAQLEERKRILKSIASHLKAPNP